jgi:hypothetical protein
MNKNFFLLITLASTINLQATLEFETTERRGERERIKRGITKKSREIYNKIIIRTPLPTNILYENISYIKYLIKAAPKAFFEEQSGKYAIGLKNKIEGLINPLHIKRRFLFMDEEKRLLKIAREENRKRRDLSREQKYLFDKYYGLRNELIGIEFKLKREIREETKAQKLLYQTTGLRKKSIVQLQDEQARIKDEIRKVAAKKTAVEQALKEQRSSWLKMFRLGKKFETAYAICEMFLELIKLALKNEFLNSKKDKELYKKLIVELFSLDLEKWAYHRSKFNAKTTELVYKMMHSTIEGAIDREIPSLVKKYIEEWLCRKKINWAIGKARKKAKKIYK